MTCMQLFLKFLVSQSQLNKKFVNRGVKCTMCLHDNKLKIIYPHFILTIDFKSTLGCWGQGYKTSLCSNGRHRARWGENARHRGRLTGTVSKRSQCACQTWDGAGRDWKSLDRGAWQATVLEKNWTQLKWLSTHTRFS